MNKNERKCRVILLSTKERSNLWSYKDRRLYYDQANFNDEDDTIYYNLYIVSEDEIKEGDWYIKNRVISQKQFSKTIILSDSKKIIATTDKFLTINEPITGKDISYGIASFIKDKDAYYKCLPQPSESFISKYIECYNKDDIIKEVMVEYEYIPGGNRVRNFETAYIEKGCGLQPKVDKNNTITIRRIKDNWSREEVKELCKSAFITGSRVNDIDYFEWEKENL